MELYNEYWETPNINIAHDDLIVQVTKYYSLHGNSRAYAISESDRIDEHGSLAKAIRACKRKIVEYRRHIEPMYGITYHVRIVD